MTDLGVVRQPALLLTHGRCPRKTEATADEEAAGGKCRPQVG